ncbi:MAG: acyl CoA:acetate/3-ketoacid CoA transferase [Vulcanimicrobiaceae bacterium]
MNSQTAQSLLSSTLRKRDKVVSAADAVRLIQDGDTIAFGGFGGAGIPEAILLALRDQFLATGKPRNLTLFYGAGQGAGGRGLNHLALEGLVERVIGGHWAWAPKLGQLVMENKAQGYNLPLGVIAQLFRDIAARKPGTLSSIGLGTFVDPRFGGGKINSITTEDLVELIEIHGQEYLFYKALPVNVAILRGTTADTGGNVTMEKEALLLDGLASATAAHNFGGIVMVQVERVAEEGSLNPKYTEIPGLLVDCIVPADPDDRWQAFGERHNPSFSGEIKVPLQSIAPLPLDGRKVIARRAAMELKPNSVVNLGIGVPEGVASVANEEKVLNFFTLTTEAGAIGGLPAGGLSFGAAFNAGAVIDMPAQFDFYDGGGLDIAFLGMAQVDHQGSVNVSKFGVKLAGAGGFINISQSAKSLVLLGLFTAGKPDIEVANGELHIRREGASRKFVAEIEERTFSGPHAAAHGKPVLYVTERCVFKLTQEGLELIEVAPGIDVERDIIGQMEFRPVMKQPPRLMDARIFAPEPMNLREYLLQVPLEERLVYDPASAVFFVNFEGLDIERAEQIDAILEIIEARLAPVGDKVRAVFNYDNFTVSLDVVDKYLEALRSVSERFFSDATRYTTSAFMRLKLGSALSRRDAAPHIFESGPEASRHLQGLQSG